MNGIECAFVGRLSQDPELRTSQAGKPWAALSVGVGEGDKVQWVRVSVFCSTAEAVASLAKGASVYVEGRLKLDTWTGKDGNERSGLSVAASVAQPMGQIGRKKLAKLPDIDARDWQRPTAAADSKARTAMIDDPIPF